MSERVPCACGALRARPSIWHDCLSLWGWPDMLLEHSPKECRRLVEDGREHEGPVMAPRSNPDAGASRGGEG